jgi:phosphohistidine phosphatase SixA
MVPMDMPLNGHGPFSDQRFRPLSLLLIRHAEAEAALEATRESDEIRALTDRGRKQSMWLALALQALAVRPDVVLTSPLVRARQTTAILRDRAFPEVSIEVVDALRPGRCTMLSIMKAVEPLAKKAVDETNRKRADRTGSGSGSQNASIMPLIALVGHQPDMGQVLMDLISPYPQDLTHPAPGDPSREMSLRKAASVLLVFDQRDPLSAPPRLELVLQPRHCREIARLHASRGASEE